MKNSILNSSYGDFTARNEFDRDEINVILICKYLASSLSVLGTIFIIISYIFLCVQVRCHKKRTFSVSERSRDEETEKKYQNLKMGFGNDLIFCLSISDFIVSILAFLKSDAIYNNKVDDVCITQGFLSNFFEISGICWTSAISFSILLGTKIKDPNLLSKSYIYLFLYSNILPSILSFGPLITNSYGPSGAWCWLNVTNNRDKPALIWGLIIYCFAWINIVFNIVAIILSINFFKVRAFEIQEERKEEFCFLRDYCIVLKFFPMILVICFIPATLNRIYSSVTEKDNTILYCFQAFFDYFQGFLNSLVYSYYYRNLFKECFKKEEVEIENPTTSQTNMISNSVIEGNSNL
jgi:hypothetical protein